MKAKVIQAVTAFKRTLALQRAMARADRQLIALTDTLTDDEMPEYMEACRDAISEHERKSGNV